MREELNQLQAKGYSWDDPIEIIEIFEQKIAEFAGSKYAVAVDSCSNGIFLSLKCELAQGTVKLPKHTYMSIPMQCIHAGCNVEFIDEEWSGTYQIKPYDIFDGAVCWEKDMYCGGKHVLSFQHKKPIPIGKGGMILVNNKSDYDWLRLARHDGRIPGTDHHKSQPMMVGWHMNMTPEDAARGILLFDDNTYEGDWRNYTDYTDLSTMDIFK